MVKENGKVNADVAQISENDENCNGAAKTSPVVKRMENPKPNSDYIQVVTTTGESEDPLANEKRTGDKLHVEVVRAELRAKYLRNLKI